MMGGDQGMAGQAWADAATSREDDLLAGFDIYGNVEGSGTSDSTSTDDAESGASPPWAALLDENTSSESAFSDDFSDESEHDMYGEDIHGFVSSEFEISPELFMPAQTTDRIDRVVGGGSAWPLAPRDAPSIKTERRSTPWASHDELRQQRSNPQYDQYAQQHAGQSVAEMEWSQPRAQAVSAQARQRPPSPPSTASTTQQQVAPLPQHPPAETACAPCSSDSGADMCPLCNRECQVPHRLGMYWRKFGYKGPPYCTRCSGVFRAHILTCTVSPGTCSRDKPCSSCAVVLGHFERPRKELFVDMDAAQPRSRCTYTRPGSATIGPQVACPLCEKPTHDGLGVFWKKFGYAGPAYCTNGSLHVLLEQLPESYHPAAQDTFPLLPDLAVRPLLQHFEALPGRARRCVQFHGCDLISGRGFRAARGAGAFDG